MIAGSLALLDQTLDDGLQSWYRRTPKRALDVSATQEDLTNDREVQDGTAVTSVGASRTRVDFVANGDGETVGVNVERDDDASRTVATDWVADVKDTGIVAAESTTDAGGVVPFPFDLLEARTGVSVHPVTIDVTSLYEAWDAADSLADVWLKGVQDEPEGDDTAATTLEYHDRAEVDGEPADLGVGFRVRWGGTVTRGVAYQSGYLALYNAVNPEEFVAFVADEILPHTLQDAPSSQQATLGEASE